jgi:hypothetical protein
MKRISRLWYVLLAVLLLSCCEKKDGLPEQIQPEATAQENPAISESVEPEIQRGESAQVEEKPPETTANAHPAEVIKVGITLRYDPSIPTIYDRIVYVDQSVTELYFLKTSIAGIDGLSQLKFLETIVFDKVSYIADFSFLTEVPHLKRLFISSNIQNIDWSFIGQLPVLEVLHVASYRQPEISIDLKNNKRLEYIGFESGILETFPTLLNVSNSLKYLNLQGNRITSLPTDVGTYSHATVLLAINPFKADAATPGNITEEFAHTVLEQNYRLPTNIPYITDAGD